MRCGEELKAVPEAILDSHDLCFLRIVGRSLYPIYTTEDLSR
jgi:hypothetical protein